MATRTGPPGDERCYALRPVLYRITEESNKHVDIALLAAAELLPALTECFCRAFHIVADEQSTCLDAQARGLKIPRGLPHEGSIPSAGTHIAQADGITPL